MNILVAEDEDKCIVVESCGVEYSFAQEDIADGVSKIVDTSSDESSDDEKIEEDTVCVDEDSVLSEEGTGEEMAYSVIGNVAYRVQSVKDDVNVGFYAKTLKLSLLCYTLWLYRAYCGMGGNICSIPTTILTDMCIGGSIASIFIIL